MSPLSPRLALVLLSLAPLGACALRAEPDAPAPAAVATAPALTLEDCIARALQKNFDLQAETLNTDNAREALTVQKADYVPVFTVVGTRSGNDSYRTGVETDGSSLRGGVSQKIPTGATVTLGTGLDRSSNNPLVTSPNPAYLGDLSVSIKQPLLKSAGTLANLAAIKRAKLGVARAELDYKSQVLAVIRDVEAAYYQLHFAREQLAARQQSLSLAEQLHREAKIRNEVKVNTDLDVLSAEVGVANNRRSVLLAEQAVRNAEDVLLNLIGQFEFGAPVGAVTFADYTEDAPTVEGVYKRALEQQPGYLAAQKAVQQYDLDTATAKNARRPTLDLGAAYGWNTYEDRSHDAIHSLSSNRGNDWQVDLTLSMPWGLKAENARYRTALNTLAQAKSRLRQQEQSILVQVRAAVLAVATGIESVKIAAQATELSRRQYEMEKARFDAGVSTAYRVLESQTDLEKARVSEVESRVNLRVAVADLQQIEGSSLARFKVAVQ
ncbi:MAG TPA: TolC family protein [Opitutaceae bacterium]|nr:TolC family protein [Opitutaceae bacterium]HPK49457.1 TolC family protein [Opitutaceae bacterium]